jgi:hypothetical protein
MANTKKSRVCARMARKAGAGVAGATRWRVHAGPSTIFEKVQK